MKPYQIFDIESQQYAQARPQYPKELFEYLADISPNHNFAWDCATGNGQAAESLSQRFNQVLATDISLAQIKNAFSAPNVHYSVQQAEQTGFSDNKFSLVIVAQALHWFDYDLYWPEVHRVLQTGGIFAAWAYTWPHVDEQIDQVIKSNLLKTIESYWASENQIAWDGYKNCSFPFDELSPPTMTMSINWTADQFLAYLGTWSATRFYMNKNGMGFFNDFAKTLKKVWQNVDKPKTITMEFYCRIGRYEP